MALLACSVWSITSHGVSNAGVRLSKSYDRYLTFIQRYFAGRDVTDTFVASVCASASAVARGSGRSGAAELIVTGSSGWFCREIPVRRLAARRVRAGSLIEPAVLMPCIVLPGQSAIRPWAPPEIESVSLNGLSHTSDGTLLSNQEPS